MRGGGGGGGDVLYRKAVMEQREPPDLLTDEQKADIFTKGLCEVKFPLLRKLLCGW